MKTLERIDIHKILTGELEEDTYKREIKFHNNNVYETYCIYNDNKVECTVFKNHERIAELDVVLDLLKENYINADLKLLTINNKVEINIVINNMIRPLLNELLA